MDQQAEMKVVEHLNRNVPQLNKQECQHVERGACIKCRYPFTWRTFIRDLMKSE